MGSSRKRTEEGWAAHSGLVRRRNLAWSRAVKDLIAENPDEFDRIYSRLCAEEDPPVTPRPVRRETVEDLERQLRDLQQQLARLEGGDRGA